MKKQQVYLGKTRAGEFGLFTNGMLAWSLDEDEYSELSTDFDKLRNYCEQRNFEAIKHS